MKRAAMKLLLVIIPAVLSLIWTGCSGSPQTEIRLLVSGDTNGVLEPCDCEVGPMGGLAKRASLLRILDPVGTALRIDLGNVVDELTDTSRFGAILEAYRIMDYNIVLPARSDSVLLKMAEVAGDHAWCGGRGPRRVLSAGGEVTFLCLSGLWTDSSTVVSDPTDFDDSVPLVWLTNLDDESLSALLRRSPKPDLVLAGGSGITAPLPDTLEGIPVFRTGEDGMDVLEVSLFRARGGRLKIKPEWHDVIETLPEDIVVKRVLECSPGKQP